MESGPQCASQVVLVRPTGFGFDPDTATTNGFQQQVRDADVRRKAEAEFDELLHALDRCGIGTTVLDPIDPGAPNAVFPNNWFSTHADGRVVLYPMCSSSRRTERDPRLGEKLRRAGFQVEDVLDLSGREEELLFLEGTGSLVLDRTERTAYAVLSPRTSEPVLNAWCEATGHRYVAFNATMDGTLLGDPVYHTNVVMSIGERFAVVCLDAIPYPGERKEVRMELELAGKDIIPITVEQMHAFVGNLLQLRSRPTPQFASASFILLSSTAFAALDPGQRQRLEKYGQLVPVPVPTIETVGGGSVRCMLAENFLPLRSAAKA
ncbi:MAG TPA: arginine deiminase-related protein [Flavobacteriales bacterium]